MKKSILLISIFLLAFTLFAQDSPDARKIVDRTYNKYISSEGIRLSFVFTTLDAEGTEYDSQKGVASIKGDKFHIEMENMDVWFDGKTQWVLMKGIDEVNISNPSERELAAISPLALLGIYKDGYILKAPLSKSINGKRVTQIEMNPVNGNREYKTISVFIDKSNDRLVQANFTMNNNMQTKIDITDYNDNYKFSDSTFVFDKKQFPNVEIVDLR
ncbi:MAG TPA: LolA-like putative outer membrane lipoprotein chaperone [Fermentimonas sp.]|nr:LolA-like putative outer membrane lipoprotein chaperone [Fermentimonas sp.]